MKRLVFNIFITLLLISSYYRFLGDFFFDLIKENYSYMQLLCEGGMVLLGFMHVNIRKDNAAIYILFCLFVLSSTMTFLFNTENVNFLTHLNGLRDYLVIFCSYFYLDNVFRSSDKKYFFRKFKHFLYFFLISQIPITLYQFTLHGASDYVGGGYGEGGSGLLTLLIYLALFFLIVFERTQSQRKHSNIFEILKFIPLIIPTFINETKITFLLLPVFLLFQIRFSRKGIVSSIFVLICAFGIWQAFNRIYSTTYEKRIGRNAPEIFQQEFLENYLARESLSRNNIARATKFVVGWEIIKNSSKNLFFGNGIGIFKGRDVLGESNFSRQYYWLLRGSLPYLFVLMMEGGLINTLIILMMIYYCFLKRKLRLSFDLIRLKIFIGFLFLLMIFYESAMQEMVFACCVSFINLYIIDQGKVNLIL